MDDTPPQPAAHAHSRPLVIVPLRDFTCAECGAGGDLLTMEDDAAVCLDCADLGHLMFLPSGDAAFTRRAVAASTLTAVVVRFSRARRRYERQGVLVEPDALAAAEIACLGDEQARARRRDRDRARREQQDEVFVADLTEAILQRFPSCPPPRAQTIAAHTGLRGSGRIGRSAAGRALDESAVTAAVVASLRHEETDYDRLLDGGVPRSEARQQVQPHVETLLATWRRRP